MLNFQEPKPKPRLDWGSFLMIALPILAVLVVTGAVTWALLDRMALGWALLDRMALGWALLIGFAAGIVAISISIGQQGNGSAEIMVAAAMVIVFVLIMLPVFSRARHNAEKRRAREALRLQVEPAPRSAKP